ncbi:NAD(P)/FAD-dependent oxidoreductase [Rhodococcus sp. NPDC127530]|uniref:NAD(P)/FAD-dependent oxidoreductase n=1 Tax=unclassified Rhodococcus (in: high G+C Gram-positive bacteria) TaxID=192944 RepID=UPI0036324621
MTDAPIVIVGASIAGITAAETLRSLGDIPVVVLDGDHGAPYDRTALSKAVLTENKSPDIALRTRAELLAMGIQLRTGAYAVGLNLADKIVSLSDGSQVGYSKLLIATGTKPTVPFTVADDANIHVLRTHADAEGLRSRLRSTKHLTVIGGGLIGGEVASAGRELGVTTTLISVEPGPFASVLGADMSAYLADLQQNSGVATRFNAMVRSVTASDAGLVVELASGVVVEADTVVAGTGVQPAVDWLAGSGLELSGGILCSAAFQSSDSDVYAAGDVARWPGGPAGEMVRLEQWTCAADQGAAAARALWFGSAAYLPEALPPPYFMTQLHGRRFQGVGHLALSEESRLLSSAGSAKPVALYRSGDRLVGSVAVDNPRIVAKCGAFLRTGMSWDEAVDRTLTLV